MLASGHQVAAARITHYGSPLVKTPHVLITPRGCSCAEPSQRARCRLAASSARLQQVIAAIDKLNSEDPRQHAYNGRTHPYELIYSQWVTEWVHKLAAEPSEELQIAARGQHVRRWTSPRSSYPEGRTAYLKWREDLKRMHSSTVMGLMAEAGYDEATQKAVEKLMLKKVLKTPEGQVLEDALCLVFLQYQFSEFRAKESEEKMVGILRKTWGKMGEGGRAAALALPLGPDEAALVGKALAG